MNSMQSNQNCKNSLFIKVRYWKLKTQFHVSDFVTPPVGSAWSVAKHSPLKRNFDEMSYRIHEMGLADKYLYDYQVAFAKVSRAFAQASNETDDTFNLNANYQNNDDTGPKPMKLANLYGGFFILGLGVCLSSAVLLIEIFKRHKIVVKQKRRWNKIRSQVTGFPKITTRTIHYDSTFSAKSTTFQLPKQSLE